MGLGANSDDDTVMHNLHSVYNKNYAVFFRIGNYLKHDCLTIHATALCIQTKLNTRFRICKQSLRNDM